MRRSILVLALLSMSLTSRGESGFVKLADEVRIPIPEDWFCASDSLNFPFQLIHENLDAEILIFKSKIATGECIDDEASLKKSVDKLVGEVIPSLPNGKLLVSSGFYDGYRTGFVLEFMSADSSNRRPLRHRLKGIIYRHPDHYQILFTIWAKCDPLQYPKLAAGIKSMQDQLVYSGAFEADVFGGEGGSLWPVLLIIMLVIGLFIYLRPRRRRANSIALPPESHFWRCDCGRLNHQDHSTCRRCGRGQLSDRVI